MSFSHEIITHYKTKRGTSETGFKCRLIMPWDGLKAVKLDINGDGTDEVAVEGVRSNLYEYVDTYGTNKTYATYKVYPYIALVQRDQSDGKLKAKDIYTGTSFISKTFTSYNGSDTNPFGLSEYQLMPVNEGEGFYPLVDRTSSI